MVVLNIEITLLMQQMIVEMQLSKKQYASLDNTMTKPIIIAADYSLVGCNTAWPTTVSAPWTDNCGVGVS
jgi:hypothetical protein